MKKATMHVFIAAGLTAMMAACGNNANTTEDNKKQAEAKNDSTFDSSKVKKDASFAVDVADAGMLEVQLGNLAQTNASSASVKKFGKEMVTDHSKANDELMALAGQKGIALPAGLSDKCQKIFNDLSAKKGHDFDKAYMEAQVSGHKDVVDAMQKESEKGEDPDLKSWAQAKLPAIQHHLEMAKQVDGALKKQAVIEK